MSRFSFCRSPSPETSRVHATPRGNRLVALLGHVRRRNPNATHESKRRLPTDNGNASLQITRLWNGSGKFVLLLTQQPVIFHTNLCKSFRNGFLVWWQQPRQPNKRYRKIFNIVRTKSQNFNVSRLGLQLSLRNILKPSVKWRMSM